MKTSPGLAEWIERTAAFLAARSEYDREADELADLLQSIRLADKCRFCDHLDEEEIVPAWHPSVGVVRACRTHAREMAMNGAKANGGGFGVGVLECPNCKCLFGR